MKWLIVILVLSVVLIAGCTTTQYVCSNGSTVSSPSLCPQNTTPPTPINGKCPAPYILQVNPQTGEQTCIGPEQPPSP